MAEKVPDRLRWAVEALAPRPGDDVLEIGCGRGVAIPLLAKALPSGAIAAIDRSATATGAARERNKALLDAGRLLIETTTLEEADLRGRRFDLIFAVNVNLFWLDAAAGLASVRRLLKPGGSLHLFYEPPSEARAHEALPRLRERLAASGFEVAAEEITPLGKASGLRVVARPL